MVIASLCDVRPYFTIVPFFSPKYFASARVPRHYQAFDFCVFPDLFGFSKAELSPSGLCTFLLTNDKMLIDHIKLNAK